jgi:penicillin amidase
MPITEADAKRAVPTTSGRVRVRGLDKPIDIVRDANGIAHVRAGSLHDAFFGQGYTHAQDRFWQMEYDRRRAAGRWSEYAGQAGLESDSFARKLDIVTASKRDYAAFSAETRAMVDAYAAGVNAFLTSSAVLPVELKLVGGTPEAWEPWHSCAVFYIRHVTMGTYAYKLWRMRILKSLGREWIDILRGGSGDDLNLIIPPGELYRDVPDGFEESSVVREAALTFADTGSNNWTVHGSRTASGKPLLAGDPHRAIDVPNVYYPNHVTCPEFNALGFSFCGVPGFPHFGHNDHVAWGVTTARTDAQDVFIERFAEGDPGRYEYKGGWEKAERRQEWIHVRGDSPVRIDVTITHHGPVVIGDPATGTALALGISMLKETNPTFECLMPMLRARNVPELDEAKRRWVGPDNNFVMADTSGNIGYVTRGWVPIRPRENGWLPVPGWTGEYDWQGYISHDEMPRSHNPAQGYVATANHRIVGPDFPHYLGFDWAPMHRGTRVNARLREMPAATVEDMTRVHADKTSEPSAAFRSLARELTPECPRCRPAVEILTSWNGLMAPASTAAAIYAVWREQLTRLVLESPALAPLVAIAKQWDPIPSQSQGINQQLRNPIHDLLKRRDTRVLPPGETWQSLGARTLKLAVDQLFDRLGDNMALWRWDAIHRTGPKHPLSKVYPEVAGVLDPPSVGVGGDGDTPQNGTYAAADGQDFTITASSVARYCWDTSDWENSGWVIPLGTSGHPGSPHFDDQVKPWSQQKLLPAPFSESAVESAAVSRQRLEPV